MTFWGKIIILSGEAHLAWCTGNDQSAEPYTIGCREPAQAVCTKRRWSRPMTPAGFLTVRRLWVCYDQWLSPKAEPGSGPIQPDRISWHWSPWEGACKPGDYSPPHAPTMRCKRISPGQVNTESHNRGALPLLTLNEPSPSLQKGSASASWLSLQLTSFKPLEL